MVPLLLISFLVASLESTNGNIHWGYKGNYGPSAWKKYFLACEGKEQSPINIKTGKTTRKNFPSFNFIKYDKDSGKFQVENNGHTVQVTIPYNDQSVDGGGLGGTYRPLQLHFHWGKNDERGSEHLVDKQSMPLEMHIVHVNTKYESSEEALAQKDGLAVLGVMFNVGAPSNPLKEFFNSLKKLESPGTSTQINAIPLVELLPENTDSFFRYQGSLTTPTCNEAVTWTLFEEPQTVSEEQLKHLRSVFADKEKTEPLVDNFRPTQPVYTRKVYQSPKRAQGSNAK